MTNYSTAVKALADLNRAELGDLLVLIIHLLNSDPNRPADLELIVRLKEHKE